MTENALVLHQDPADDVVLSDARIISALREIGFISEALDFDGRQHYRPGDEFLYLLTFLGCSPVVALGEPGATGESFCHIALLPHEPQLRLLSGDNVKTPRCRRCGHRFEDWSQLFTSTESLSKPITCPECTTATPPARLKWRQSAGISRRFLVVYGIFEGEAVPGEELMGTLEGLGSKAWGYFYYRGAQDALGSADAV